MFRSDEWKDRQALIEALRALSVPAYEYHSGGGHFHVAVDLLEDSGSEDLLQIATGSSDTACDVGLMGWRNGGSWESRRWVSVASREDAVEQFLKLWDGRDGLVGMFRRGEIAE